MTSRQTRQRAARRQQQKQHRNSPDNEYKAQYHDDGPRRILPPTTKLSSNWTTITLSYLLKDAFRLHTLLAIGGIVQMGLSASIRQPWCNVPVMVVLLVAAMTTLAQIVCPHRGWSFLAGAVPGRSTAMAGRELVVFHFGARFNHPLGLLAPGGPAMTRLFQATVAALDEDRSGRGPGAYGLRGANLFRGGERAVNATILLVLYFDSVADLQTFARSTVHTRATQWLGENRRRYPHLSAFHETFCVPAGQYETLYINTAPILLGNTYDYSYTYTRQRADADQDAQVARSSQEPDNTAVETVKTKSGDVWINALVDADHVQLQTMEARLNHAKV